MFTAVLWPAPPTYLSSRFFGLDTHNQYLEIAAVDNQGKLLFNKRVAIDDLAHWAAEHLIQDDAAVLEAGSNTWWAYDTLKPHVGRVVVANPLKTRLIAEARIKTDRLSAETLARLLQANFICEVWMPDEQTREQRALVSHRVFLSRNSTRLKNRFHRQCATTPNWASSSDVWKRRKGTV